VLETCSSIFLRSLHYSFHFRSHYWTKLTPSNHNIPVCYFRPVISLPVYIATYIYIAYFATCLCIYCLYCDMFIHIFNVYIATCLFTYILFILRNVYAYTYCLYCDMFIHIYSLCCVMSMHIFFILRHVYSHIYCLYCEMFIHIHIVYIAKCLFTYILFILQNVYSHIYCLYCDMFIHIYILFILRHVYAYKLHIYLLYCDIMNYIMNNICCFSHEQQQYTYRQWTVPSWTPGEPWGHVQRSPWLCRSYPCYFLRLSPAKCKHTHITINFNQTVIELVRKEDFFQSEKGMRIHKMFKKRVCLDVAQYGLGNRVCDQWNKLLVAIVLCQGRLEK